MALRPTHLELNAILLVRRLSGWLAGSKTIASKVAFNALNASLALTPTNGNPPLKMLPLFTWLVSRRSGGKFYGCSLEVRSALHTGVHTARLGLRTRSARLRSACAGREAAQRASRGAAVGRGAARRARAGGGVRLLDAGRHGGVGAEP